MDFSSLKEPLYGFATFLQSIGLGTEELVWLLAPIVALYIAVRGWNLAEADKRKREEKEEKVLVEMLKKEVGIRWPKIEQRTLDDRILQFRYDERKFVDQLAHRRLRPDEFFVIHSICKDYYKFSYLDSELLGMLMGTYAAWLDVIDTRDNADHLIHEIQDEAWKVAVLNSESVDVARKRVEKKFADRLQRLAVSTDERIACFKQRMKNLMKKLRLDGDQSEINGQVFVLCLKKDDNEVVEPSKVYKCFPNEEDRKYRNLTVVDDTGQSRQCPRECFVEIELPRGAEQAVTSSA